MKIEFKLKLIKRKNNALAEEKEINQKYPLLLIKENLVKLMLKIIEKKRKK